MNVKKVWCLLLALAMVLALTSCVAPEEPENIDGTENMENTEPEGANGEEPDGSDETGETDEWSYSDGFDERGFFAGVVASELVTLPEYKGLTLPGAPSEEGVLALIDEVLAYYPLYEQITDRPLENLDTVNIDYVGSVDGVEFAGGSTGGYGTTVTIGVTSYIDDFLEQLIGHMPGENFDIEVTFPDPYLNNPDMSGVDAVFNITINYIQGDELERELDEEIAAAEGFADVDELLYFIENLVLSDERSAIVDEMLSRAVCGEVPQSVVDTVTRFNLAYYEDMAISNGMTLEMLLSFYGFESVDSFTAELEPDIREAAARYLAVQAIAEIENLEVTVEDVAEAGAESAIAYYGGPYIYFNLLNTNVVPAFIFENAVIE